MCFNILVQNFSSLFVVSKVHNVSFHTNEILPRLDPSCEKSPVRIIVFANFRERFRLSHRNITDISFETEIHVFHRHSRKFSWSSQAKLPRNIGDIISGERCTKFGLLCVFPLINDKLRHNTVKVAEDPPDVAEWIHRRYRSDKENRKHFERFYVLLACDQENPVWVSRERGSRGLHWRDPNKTAFLQAIHDHIHGHTKKRTPPISPCSDRYRFLQTLSITCLPAALDGDINCHKINTYLPLRPARAVLPTLWIYCFSVGGRLALMTCWKEKFTDHSSFPWAE